MPAARLPYWELAPNAFERMRALSDTVHQSSLGPKLLDLVFLRASQINGCAFCIDMHTRDLLKHGEDLQRINSVLVWHDTDFFQPARMCGAGLDRSGHEHFQHARARSIVRRTAAAVFRR